MFILDEGRAAFLDFLRNLTPQVLLLSLTFVVGAKLDLGKFDTSNWAQTLVFLSFLVTAVLAGWANTTLFISKFAPLEQLRHDADFVGPRLQRTWRTIFTYTWTKKRYLLELVFAILLIELIVVAIFAHSLFAASKMSL